MRIVHVWRHTRSLKRSGRGHAKTGAKGTSQGELAVLCPACPYDGINLPPNWKQCPRPLMYVSRSVLSSVVSLFVIGSCLLCLSQSTPTFGCDASMYRRTPQIPVSTRVMRISSTRPPYAGGSKLTGTWLKRPARVEVTTLSNRLVYAGAGGGQQVDSAWLSVLVTI